jgi:hypothetical protein
MSTIAIDSSGGHFIDCAKQDSLGCFAFTGSLNIGDKVKITYESIDSEPKVNVDFVRMSSTPGRDAYHLLTIDPPTATDGEIANAIDPNNFGFERRGSVMDIYTD